MKDFLDSWVGYSLICPADEDYPIMGDPTMMESKQFVFQIRKCQPKPDSKCEEDETINEIAKHTSVETWVMDEKTDFSIYD